MALPAIASVQPADVLVPRWLVPVVEMAGLAGDVVPFDPGVPGLLAAAGELRRRGYARGVLLAPSFSAALLFLLGGVRERRGATSDGRGVLITDPVADAAMAGRHRSATYHVLARGEVPEPLPSPRLVVPGEQRAAWAALVEAAGSWRAAAGSGRAGGQEGATIPPMSGSRRSAADTVPSSTPALPPSPGAAEEVTIGLFPGSKATSRRWDTDRFAELARRVAAGGARVVVFGGAGETELTRQVAGDVAFDAGGRTPLPLLAAGLAACDLLVTNDSGPMHLAAAVGTRTISLQGASDPRRTRPLGREHLLLQHPELACVPCVRNECPRHGPGTFLRESDGAQRECLRLITTDDVEAAVRAVAHGSAPGPAAQRPLS